MVNYNQTSSFNTEFARIVGIEAALVYQEISFWSTKGKRPDGFIYKTLEELSERLPIKPRTIRRNIDRLVEAGYLEKQLMKVNGAPTVHFRITKELRFVQTGQMESDKVDKTKDLAKMDKTINSNIPSTNNINPSDFSGASETPPTPPHVTELLEQVIAIINPRERVIPERIRQINGRLKDGYTSNEILHAAKAFSKSEWHKEHGQMSVDNLIRAGKFGRWFAAAKDDGIDTLKTQEELMAEFTAETDRERADALKRMGGK